MVVDSSATQCNADSDCKALGPAFEKAICNVEKRVCVKGPECTKNTDCLDQPALCRQSDKTCQKLVSAECVVKAESSDLTNDSTLWFGLLSPRNDSPHMEAAADLVRWQISKNSNLPPAEPNGKRRPLGFVSCTTDNMAFEKSMEHLLNLELPALVGPNSSGDVVNLLNNYTVKNGILAMSPTAAAPNISDIQNMGLFFRMSGTDTIAVKTLAHVLRKELETKMRTPTTPNERPMLAAGEQMKVAVMYKADALGISNANSAAQFVTFNGKSTAQNGSNYQVINYGDPAETNTPIEPKYQMAINKVVEFAPHVIFVFGSNEFKAMDKEIERRWPTTVAHRPYWLVVKGIANVFSESIGTNENWARRVYGAQPYVDKSTPAYRSFEPAFRERFPTIAASATVTATPSYFDAAYVLAYAVAANGNRPITGANLANAIRERLTPGPYAKAHFVGYDSVLAVFTALSSGERVDLTGLTGSLNFEENGDVPQTQEVFCMKTEGAPPALGKVVGVKAAGMIFDPIVDSVTGTIDGCPGP